MSICPFSSHLFFERGVDISVEYLSHFIVLIGHVAELVKKELCKIFACLDSFGLGYRINEGHAIDNYHFVLR